MQTTPSIVDEIYSFFDLKLAFQRDLEEVEKSVYRLSKDLENLRLKHERLSKMAQKHNNEYFKLKVQTLELHLKKLRIKKGYRQLEFDRIFKILSQIKQTDKVELLDEAIKSKIEKIAQTQQKKKRKNFIPERENRYLIFNFQKTLYTVPSLPKRILREVPYSKKHLTYKGKKFPIFPNYVSTLFDESYKSNIIVLRKGLEFFALRYDFFEDEIELAPEELKNKLCEIENPLSFLKYFIKWKGMKCYFINF